MDFNNKQKNNSKITSKLVDITKWYTELIFYAKLAKYGPVKGTIYICPNAYYLWEQIQLEANKIFKQFKIQNVYFPLFIPLSFFEKEKIHIEGFKPELAIINEIGEKKLNEPITIRPTSEILFCEYFKSEIQSYKDLPIMLNQWCNVIRWEKNTRPFLRNSEFLWQEGHSAFATTKETIDFTLNIIRSIQEFFHKFLGLYTILGKKTNNEKFAGAIETYTIETILPNGYGLQIMTSHYLGKNFSKNFNINYLNKNNEKEYISQNSFGFSTRLLAALIMMHGDDYGLVLPINLAKYQINILSVFKKNNDSILIEEQIDKIIKLFGNKYIINIDKSDKPLGYKCIQSELEGIPIYIEVGYKDIEKQIFNVYSRFDNKKLPIKFNDLKLYVSNLLDNFNTNLFNRSKNMIENKIKIAKNKSEILSIIHDECVALAPFSFDDKLEADFKNEYAISIRCIHLDKEINNEKCALDENQNSKGWVYFAKAY